MMEDISTKKDYLERKLGREVTNLERLKASLDSSSTQTVSMLKVLDKFQERLQKLENTIQPVYKQTRNYQLRQDNIERTLTSIDNVIGFYHVARDTKHIICGDHISKDLREYMGAMVQIKNAIDYFSHHHRGSPEYSEVNTLYQTGKKAIEREFQLLLKQHSKPLLPVTIADMLGVNDDPDLGVQQPPLTSEQYMPQSIREQLEEISKWLFSNLSTTDFMTAYAETRSAALTKSLQGLIDQQKSSSGESIVSASPSTITAITRTKKNKGRNLLKKTLLRGSEASAKKEEEVFVIETEGYINCVSALLKLIEFEMELMNAIIPFKHRRKVYEIMIQPSLELIVLEGEKLGESAQKSASHYNFKEVHMLFPVVKHLRTVKPEFDVKLEGCQPINRSRFAALITNLDNTGNSILSLFIESIKNDPDKSSNMPLDGTVHELTRNTMSFMTILKENAEVAGAMLLVQDPMYREQNLDHLTIKVADYMTKVLSALGINLKNKSNLLPLIHKYDPQVGQYYSTQSMEQKKKYHSSFRYLLDIIATDTAGGVTKHSSQQRNTGVEKISDKERQSIKDRFVDFNKGFEDLCRVQKAYAIPDSSLRDLLKKENRERVVPQYTAFKNKYSKTNFTKNPDKYIKYTEGDVADMLDKVFDSTF
ncbi:EXOC7 [Bugula neritina]|uniref:Exocyst complex component 7 n=1 Tax=Bugula neritina TaxID=10212 RepID=A0A7J7KD35_BUGNE|nr:EXOC7 [Bugula neritina]